MDSTMEDSGNCSSCQKDGMTTTGSNYCTDCKIYFCNKCLKRHMTVPNYQDHDITKPIGNKRMKLEEAFMCKEHDKTINHFCKNCVKPVCKVCNHKRCNDVVTIKNMLPEVKGQLMKRQETIGDKVERNKANIAKFDVKVKSILMKSASVKTNITKTIQASVDRLREKETELLEKMDIQTDQQTEKLKGTMNREQTETQMYQQQSEFIQQALELEDEAQLFEMYLSSGSGAGEDITEAQREERVHVADIKVLHTPDRLKEEIEKMDVRSVDYIIDRTATPQLYETINAKYDVCDVRDVVVMNISAMKDIVFAHYYTKKLLSVYKGERRTCSSVLQMSDYPWCMTVISEGKVAVSLHKREHIIVVSVTPDLELVSTIQTRKAYWGLSTLNQSTIVAGSDNPPSFDLVDMNGTIWKTFTTIPTIEKSFIEPHYIYVTRQGTILVSDCGLKSVICMTQSGDIVFTYTPTGDRALRYPFGITSTNTGDILVADWDTHKVIHLSEKGEFIRNILTAADGLENPFGLCFDEDKLCVTIAAKGLHKYKFVKQEKET